jgi:hypothetical protein
MHIPTPRLALTFICLLGMTLPSSAARKVRAIFISPGTPALEKATLFTGTQSVEVELPQRNLSPEVSLPDGDLLVAILPAPPATGEDLPAAAPKIKIPAAWERCILLFFPDPTNPVFPARVIPVNASTADFPKGHSLIYNVSNASILAKFGEEQVSVKPGSTASLKPPITGLGDYLVAIDCILPEETKPTAICRSSWQHDPDARQILFITPTPGFKVPRVWGILDRQQETRKTDD